MRTPRLYRVHGIILSRIDFGEADRVITLYTAEAGKVRAVAKGVRKTTSRLAGHLELFVEAQLQIARGRNLDVITQSVTQNAFRTLREDLWRTTYACVAAELTDRFTVEGVTIAPLFDLLRLTLERLDADRDPELAIRLFEVQALGLLGYRPELQQCVNCRTALTPTGNFFAAIAGGVLCFDCGRADATSRALTTNAFKLLRLMQAGDYATLTRVRIGEPLRRELEAITRGHIAYLLERELKSTDVLSHIRALLPGDRATEAGAETATSTGA